MKRQSRKPASTDHRLRIIAGQWRGRKLPVVAVDGLRPTGDRLRETLFNWLAPYLPGARCLDLFAGTGALGLEALSRGAASATLIEANPSAAVQLRANCATLQTSAAQVVEGDALGWLKQHQPRQFNLVFLDPPFTANLWQTAVDSLERQGLLSDEAYIYVETPKDIQLLPPENWTLHRSKATGAVCARLFLREAL